jgi:hypothetical protein
MCGEWESEKWMAISSPFSIHFFGWRGLGTAGSNPIINLSAIAQVPRWYRDIVVQSNQSDFDQKIDISACYIPTPDIHRLS